MDYPVPISSGMRDKKYLKLVDEKVTESMDKWQPKLVIYNAGTDIYEKDPLGRLNITDQGIIERDRIVFDHAKRREIRIAMVLSGGYHKDSGKIIGESIKGIIRK